MKYDRYKCLDLIQTKPKRLWETTKRLIFRVYGSGTRVDGTTITVPAGMRTDLASIPKRLQWLISKRGEHDMPAVLHDYLYRFGHTSPGSVITRKEADKAFYVSLINFGASRAKARVFYWAVRLGGRKSWRYGI